MGIYLIDKKRMEVSYKEGNLEKWTMKAKDQKDLKETIKHLEDFKAIIEYKENSNVSVKVDMSKYQHDNYSKDRELTVTVTVTAKSDLEAEKAFNKLADHLGDTSDTEIVWSTCPTIEEEKGKFTYTEIFSVQYEHGFMAGIKKDLRNCFKISKKALGFN